MRLAQLSSLWVRHQPGPRLVARPIRLPDALMRASTGAYCAISPTTYADPECSAAQGYLPVLDFDGPSAVGDCAIWEATEAIDWGLERDTHYAVVESSPGRRKIYLLQIWPAQA